MLPYALPHGLGRVACLDHCFAIGILRFAGDLAAFLFKNQCNQCQSSQGLKSLSLAASQFLVLVGSRERSCQRPVGSQLVHRHFGADHCSLPRRYARSCVAA